MSSIGCFIFFVAVVERIVFMLVGINGSLCRGNVLEFYIIPPSIGILEYSDLYHGRQNSNV